MTKLRSLKCYKKMKRTVWCCPEVQTATVVQKHYYKLMHSCCVKEKLPLALCTEAWWDGKKAEDSWAVLLCSSFVFLHLQLAVPLGSGDQTLSSTDPTFSTNTLCLPSHLPPLCCRPLSPSDGWQGLLWRRLVGTLLVLVSKLKLCLRERDYTIPAKAKLKLSQPRRPQCEEHKPGLGIFLGPWKALC